MLQNLQGNNRMGTAGAELGAFLCVAVALGALEAHSQCWKHCWFSLKGLSKRVWGKGLGFPVAPPPVGLNPSRAVASSTEGECPSSVPGQRAGEEQTGTYWH